MATPQEARAELARRELERRRASSDPVNASPAEETTEILEEVSAPEPKGLLSRSMDRARLGVSDAMSTMAGDTYGRNGDPTQKDQWKGGYIGEVQRLTKALGGDIAPALGDIGMDVTIESGKGVLNDEQEARVAKDVGRAANYIAGSDAGQAVGQGLKAWKAASPESYATAGEVANIGATFAPVLKAKPKFGINAKRKLEQSIKNRKVVETQRLLEPDNLRGPGDLTEPGLMRTRTYTPKPGSNEERIAARVAATADVDPRRSYNYNTGVIDKEITRVNNELVSSLDGVPAVSVVTVEDAVDDAIDAARRLPNLQGEAGAQATVLADHVDLLIKKYKNADGTIDPDKLLQVRRDLDSWTKKYGPEDLYGEKGSALSDANNEIREALNVTLGDAAPNAAVREQLTEMSDLLTAKTLTYIRSLPNREKGNRFSRYLDNLERSTGVKHPTNPQSIAITAGNPVVGVGAAAAALTLGAKQNIGAGLARNSAAAKNMTANAIRESSAGAQRSFLIDALKEEEEN